MQVFWGEARKGTVGMRNCKVDGETGHKIDTHNSLPPQLRWWPMNVNDAGASSVGKKRKQNGHKTLLIKQIKTVLLLAIEAQEGERSNIRKEKKPSLQEICTSHRVRREEKFDGQRSAPLRVCTWVHSKHPMRRNFYWEPISGTEACTRSTKKGLKGKNKFRGW